MKTHYPLTILITMLGVLFFANSANSQDFVYTPTNPAFGGDTFNYQWMLSSAKEQNKFKEESPTTTRRDALADFEENLNRQILNQLSRRLVGDAFGDDELGEGVFEIGTFRVEITNVLEGVSITILNTIDGGETNVIVPFQ